MMVNKYAETIAAAVLLFLGYMLIVRLGCGCNKQAIAESVAEATYLGQQLQCVDNLNTREDIDGCRASVRRKWGIEETIRDAGTQ